MAFTYVLALYGCRVNISFFRAAIVYLSFFFNVLFGVSEASGSNGQAEQARSGGWALPSSEYSHTVGTISEARDEVGSSRSQERVLRTNSSGRNAYRPGVGRRRH